MSAASNSVSRLVALGLLFLMAPAAASEWELTGERGMGRVFGTGTSTREIEGSYGAAVNLQVLPWASVAVRGLLQRSSFRTTERPFRLGDSGHNGLSVGMLGGVYWHPFSRRYSLQPFLGGLVGLGYTWQGFGGDVIVEHRQRDFLIGGHAGLKWAFTEHWALGGGVILLPIYAMKSCIAIHGDATSCEIPEVNDNFRGDFNLSLSYRFEL